MLHWRAMLYWYFILSLVAGGLKIKRIRQAKTIGKKYHGGQYLTFRGAGNLAYFHIGIWLALVKFSRVSLGVQRFLQQIKFRGLSSGGLIATLAACNVNLVQAMQVFDQLLDEKRKSIAAADVLTRAYYLPWNECRLRFSLVPEFFKTMITDEQVKNCSGRLTIVTMSLPDFDIVERDTWDSVEEVTEWVCASMSIPGVTSLPRLVNVKGKKRWLMDPFDLDFYRGECVDRADREIAASPINISSNIVLHPPVPFPALCCLLGTTADFRKYVVDTGYRTGASWCCLDLDGPDVTERLESKRGEDVKDCL